MVRIMNIYPRIYLMLYKILKVAIVVRIRALYQFIIDTKAITVLYFLFQYLTHEKQIMEFGYEI